MSTWNRCLWRVARRLEAAYRAARNQTRGYFLPETSWNDARCLLERLAVAEARGWQAAARYEREAAADELDGLSQRLRELAHSLRNERPRAVPALRTLYEELLAVAEQFDDLQIEDGLLGVTTGPIVLEDVALGRFAIRLEVDRIGGDAPYHVVALEPNPAASSSETTHPHVHAEKLCPGEGRQPIIAALAEGRLFDFFLLVNQILKNYAPGSAYVDLDRWYGVPCHDCDCQINEEDGCTCGDCEATVCGDCLQSCGGCGDGYCSGCIQRCERCEEHACGGCLKPCVRCRRDVCEACREDGLCETCREELEEEHNEETDETPVEPSGAAAEPAV